ncbi:MAG TPA: sugar phosphate isomerase/epimerase family protein, partial [bacterium]|nr:sugar phosphate isomerase/epimerase family protein [bacterium]
MNERQKIGVIYYNFSFTFFPEFVTWCQQHQANFVEIQAGTIYQAGNNPEKQAEKMAALLRQHQIVVSQLSAGNDFLQRTPAEFKAQIERLLQVCRLAKILGTSQLRIDGGWPKEGVPEEKYFQLILDGVKQAVEIAERENLHLALDNHGSVTNNYQLQLEVFSRVASPRLGANLDTMNYRWYGYSVEELPGIYQAMAPFVKHTHLKDGTGTRSAYQGRVLGEGEIPLKEAVAALRKAGYTGVWCAEYEGSDKEAG